MRTKKFQRDSRWQDRVYVRRHSDVRALSRPHRRVLFYSHDTYGLGHIRRSLCLIRALLEEDPRVEVLLATGSPVIDKVSVPAGVRILALKPVVKTAAETYEARDGTLSRREVVAHRSAQIVGAVRFFDPHVAVVDHAPLGMKGELVAALEILRNSVPRPRLVLGLRDILDEPHVVRRTWREHGVYEALDRYYDRILVYGERRHFAVDEEYALPEKLCAKVEYTGYLRKSELLVDAEHVRSEFAVPPGAPLLVATVGGGGDGFDVLSTTIAAVPRLRRAWPDLRALVVTGPLMDGAHRLELEGAAERIRGVTITSFVQHLTSVMAAADALVGMAGYNTVTEFLAAGRPAVLVPRTKPRREQWIRARLLERCGLAHVVEADDLTPERLAATVGWALAEGPRREGEDSMTLCGTERAVAAIQALFHAEDDALFGARTSR